MSWQKLTWRAFPALVVIMLIAVFIAGKEAVAEALVAWGTIVLAYATFMLVKENRDQEVRNRTAQLEMEERYRKAEAEKEDRYRKDQREREDRERKERLLNEIKDWVDDINMKVILIGNDPINKANSLDSMNDIKIGKVYLTLALSLINERINVKYFQSLGNEISIELGNIISKLDLDISNLADKLKKMSLRLHGLPADIPLSKIVKQSLADVPVSDMEIDNISSELVEYATILNLSIIEILSEVAKAKLALLKQ
jgi:hypothetical protein